ncbi:hypothetical protein TIFTF001_031692 [Ficus carica]|uniref:Uncharacterized protein n=1 Tax=Ficus carica TaxID=3494 RepID=A0AA88J4L0_FICCA|nr:hypothetical protein TIFTF001_031692 [Ficus carica]
MREWTKLHFDVECRDSEKSWLGIRPKVHRHFSNLTRRRICLTGVGEGNTSTFKLSEERGRAATNQSSCYAADARWDGGTSNRPTDTNTWAPEWRREIRAQEPGTGETEWHVRFDEQ